MNGAPVGDPGGIRVAVGPCEQVWMQLDGPGITVVLDQKEALLLAHMLASAVIDLRTRVQAGEGVH